MHLPTEYYNGGEYADMSKHELATAIYNMHKVNDLFCITSKPHK